MATSSPRVAFQRTPFVAREHEMAQLTRALDEAQAGRGALVLLRGDAGIGKSRIADELVNHAQSAGFLALTGYCHEGDAAPAYAPFVQALEGVLTAMPAATLDDAVESAGLGVLQLLPKLAGGAEPYQVPAEMQRHHLFNSVNEFLAHLSQANPVLLVLEDLHWAAAPTVLLLRHLAESLGSGRLLIVGTHRPIELNTDASEEPPLGTLLEGLNKLSRAHSLEVGPLSQGGVAEIVSVFGGAGSPPALVRAICEQTEGNPFFVEEVVKHLAEEGRLQDSHGAWAPYATSEDLNVPESVRLVIGRRLTRMSEDCRKVLTAAGVIGRTFDYRLLAAVVDVDAERLLDSLDEAARARLITSGGSDYDTHLAFSHELIRQTLLLQVSLPRRQQLHLRVLSAIEERQSTGRAEFADLARHSLRAGPFADPETTIGYVMHAAERAMTATAYEEAARLYRHLLKRIPADDLERRCEILLRTGIADRRTSDTEDARELFLEAASIARKLGDTDSLARAALGFARSWPTVGEVDEQAVAMLRDAEAGLGEEATPLRAQVLCRLASQMLYSGDPAAVRALSQQAVETARQAGDPVALARALQTHHVTIWEPRQIGERLAVTAEILEISRRSGIDEIALWSHRPRIADLMAMGETRAAEEELAAFLALCERYHQPIYTWQAAVRRTMLATFRGRLAEAERLAGDAMAIGQDAGGQNLVAAFGEQMLIIRWLQGRLRELEPLARASLEHHPAVAVWRAVMAFIYAETGRLAEARREFDYLAADGFARLARDDTRQVSIVLMTVVCARLGDGEAAVELYEQLEPYEGRNLILSEGVTCVGAASHYLGLLAATSRRWQAAELHFRDALEMNERTGGRPWLAHSQFAWGWALLHRRGPGDRKRGIDVLEAAMAVATALDMTSLQQEAERLLAPRRERQARFPKGLTPREAEVLRLLAMGRSNKEISETLVLSLRTTARHVTNIYAKIGARNRADATVFAIRHNLIHG